MIGSKFYSDLTKFVKIQDGNNANRVVMIELGNLLVKNKADFIEVIRGANIRVPDNATDIQLINAFVDNAPRNRKLLLGASFLINHNNKTVGFNGEDEISDSGVKATYKVMHSYFDASQYEDTSDIVNDDYYGATGEDYSEAGWGDAVASLGNIGGKVLEGQQAKKMGASTTLAKQQDARKQMTQTILAQRQAQADEKAKEKERKHKTTKTLLIVGGVILGLAIIGGVIYAVKKSRTK